MYDTYVNRSLSPPHSLSLQIRVHWELHIVTDRYNLQEDIARVQIGVHQVILEQHLEVCVDTLQEEDGLGFRV
jgi:hypothetical protein